MTAGTETKHSQAGEAETQPATSASRWPTLSEKGSSDQTGGAEPGPGARYLSIVEAAGYLNVGVRFMRRLVADRRIRYYKVGKFLRFDPADLDAFAIAGEVQVGQMISRLSRGRP